MEQVREDEHMDEGPSLLTPWRAAMAVVAAAAALAFLPSLFGEFVWDDPALVSGAAIGGGKSLAACFTEPFLRFYYRPLVSASFFLENRLWPEIPLLYHQTNIGLHVGASLLWMWALLLLFGSRRIAALGALLFAVQPAQVSTVAFIGGRTDSLCALWVALFTVGLAQAARSQGSRRTKWLAVGLAAYVLAVLTKEQTVLLAALVPAALWWLRAPNSPRPSVWRALLATAPFAAAGVGLAAAWVHIAPPRPVGGVTLATQFVEAGQTMAYYVLLLVAPSPTWMHTTSLSAFSQAGAWPIALGWGALAALVALGIYWARRLPAAAWVTAFILVTILPVCNFVPVPSLMVAPYRAGVTGLGAAALIALALAAGSGGAHRCLRRPALAWTRPAAAVGLTIWCAGLTVWGCRTWHDPVTLYQTLSHYDPGSTLPSVNLATALIASDQPERAVTHIERALRGFYRSDAWRDPDAAARAVDRDPAILRRVREHDVPKSTARLWLARFHASLGNALINSRRFTEAEGAYRTGAAVEASSPDVNVGLGICAFTRGNHGAAIRHMKAALKAAPHKTDAHRILARAYAAQGRWRLARQEMLACVRAEPHVAMAYVGLAHTELQLGDRAAALRALRHAVRTTRMNDEARQMLADLEAGRTYRGVLPFGPADARRG